jgi:hypothetical protein
MLCFRVCLFVRRVGVVSGKQVVAQYCCCWPVEPQAVAAVLLDVCCCFRAGQCCCTFYSPTSHLQLTTQHSMCVDRGVVAAGIFWGLLALLDGCAGDTSSCACAAVCFRGPRFRTIVIHRFEFFTSMGACAV